MHNLFSVSVSFQFELVDGLKAHLMIDSVVYRGLMPYRLICFMHAEVWDYKW